MSRCIPFPPPGYLRNGSRREALIEESIKLRMEMEKAEKVKKEKKKERKREKKEKRREKKERKEKEKEAKASLASGDGRKLKHVNESKEIQADGKLQKGEDYENEQHERSGITEELDQPVTSREHCCLSDSTQSSKRKRSSSQSSHDQGPIIRIQLPLRKHKEPEESKLEFQSGSSSQSASFTRKTGGSDHKLQSNIETSQFLGNPDSRHCDTLPTLVSGDNKATNSVRNDKRRSSESLYTSLLQIPPVTFDGFDLDEDWLFKSEKTEERPAKRAKTDAGAFQCAKSLWPHAQYMPEVDMYALPYTVPF